MKETFTGRVRDACHYLGEYGNDIALDQLYDRVDVRAYKERRQVRLAVAELCKSRELYRWGEGTYRLLQQPPGKPQIQEVMWRILRARRTVTLADMEELAGASPTYATEWLQMLSRRKIVRHLKNGGWQMVTDPGPTVPLNDEKAERLRNLRAKKKEALECMDRAFVAIAEARMAMSEMIDY